MVFNDLGLVDQLPLGDTLPSNTTPTKFWVEEFPLTVSGSQMLTLEYTPVNFSILGVLLNGIRAARFEYTLSGKTLTLLPILQPTATDTLTLTYLYIP